MGVARGDRRHDRGIDHAQTLDAAHFEIGIYHRAGVVGAAHFAGADRMKNRGADVTCGLHQFIVGLKRRAGHEFFRLIFFQRFTFQHDAARDAN